MRRWARVGGWLVAALAIGYFANAAYRNFSAIPAFQPDARNFGMTAVAVAAYGLSVPCAALGWRWLLAAAGREVSYASSLAILSLTQFAKYIPGNVANLLGRIEFARRWGVDVGAGSVSVTFEFLLVLGVGVALAAAVPFTFEGYGALPLSPMSAWTVLAGGAALLIPLSLLLAMTAAARRLSVFLQVLSRPRNVVRLIAATLTYVGCYFASGGSLLALAIGPASAAGADLFELTLVFAMAFVGGYLTPGVPAGLGVREALLVAMLSPAYGEGPSLALALYFRVVATVGDALIAGGSLLVSRRLRQTLLHIGGVGQDGGQRVADRFAPEASRDLRVQDPAI
jgi:uncharacterized membrane protein YbhN (UPF0104 family)